MELVLLWRLIGLGGLFDSEKMYFFPRMLRDAQEDIPALPESSYSVLLCLSFKHPFPPSYCSLWNRIEKLNIVRNRKERKFNSILANAKCSCGFSYVISRNHKSN